MLIPTFLALVSAVHGGSYPGPPVCGIPAVVPPTGGSSDPNAPSPGSPGSPGNPSVPTGPIGGASPGGLVSGPVGPAQSTTPALSGRDLFDWSNWWYLERDLFLWSPERLRQAPLTQFDPANGQDLSGKPSRETVITRVIPALLSALKTERNGDIQTAALIALARAGGYLDDTGVNEPVQSADPGAEAIDSLALDRLVRAAFRKALKDPSQEVSETAVLSFGILGGDASLSVLLEILAGTTAAETMIGGGRVPTRARAFAAFGLGLLAERTEDAAMKRTIALALIDALDAKSARHDVGVAASIAMGHCGVPVKPGVPGSAERSHPSVDAVISRSSQIRWLLQRCSPERSAESPAGPFVRAHGLVALARLGRGAPDASRDKVLTELQSVAANGDLDGRMRGAALVALGELLEASERPADRAGIDFLRTTLTKGQPMERRFAAIALAQSSARGAQVGDGVVDGAAVAFGSARSSLHDRLVRGGGGERPWIALALGIQAHAASESGLQVAGGKDLGVVRRELVKKLDRCSSAASVGAYAIGTALAFVHADVPTSRGATTALKAAFERTKDPAARGHVAIALGMLRERSVIPGLHEMLAKARFQPDALWSAAVSLRMMGDHTVSAKLLKILAEARSGATRAAVAASLGRVGDEQAVEPILKFVEDKSHPASARAFGIVGLGILCDDDQLPWSTPVSHALPYFTPTATLWGDARGILDIL